MKINDLVGVVLFFLLLAGAFFAGRHFAGKETVIEQQIVRDTTIIRDTVKIPIPKQIITEVVEYDTIYVEKPTLAIPIPIEEKTYSGTDYKAVVRGYKPRLMSLDIYRTDTLFTINTINKVIKTKRWNLTVGAQVGYGYTPRGQLPYVGVGVTFGYSF